MAFTTEQIARVCHEANRAFCCTLGDLSQPEWNEAPQWQKDSALKGVEFHLFVHADVGEAPPPETSHQSWLAEKTADGWKYGPVKDPAKKEHPCFVPYAELPVEQRMKDYIFGSIVAAFVDAKGEK